jgi:hypothetical protein
MGTGSGQIVLEYDFRYIANRTFRKPIGRILRPSPAAGLVDNTYTAIAFTSEDYDTHGFHSTSVNPSRITPTIPGYYRFKGSAFFSAQSTPVHSDWHFRMNGISQLPGGGRMPGQTSAFGGVAFACMPFNGVHDYIEFIMRQDSAGGDDTNITSPFIPVVEWEFDRDL